LNARRIDTTECPVLFEAPEAGDLIGFFVRLAQFLVPCTILGVCSHLACSRMDCFIVVCFRLKRFSVGVGMVVTLSD
jgi:hypothetical protein